MAPPIYYGQRAYEGFAKAFASRLGVSVTVSGSNTAPHVDSAGTIHLPGLNGYHTQEQFEDLCATVIHETAHVVYGSHKLFEGFNSAKKPRLWMECLNAVLDIADETAMGAQQANSGNPRADKLMIASAVRACRQPSLLPNPYKRKPNNAPAHWRILATGIIRTRCKGKGVRGITTYGNWLIREFPQLAIADAFKIMLTCRGSKYGSRYPEGFLVSRADALYGILESIAPPDGEEPTPMPGGAGQPMPGTGTLPAGAVEADGSEGEDLAGPNTPAAPKPMGGTGAGGGGYDPNVRVADRGCYETMLPIVKRVAQRLATDGEAINNEGGFTSGVGVRDAYRLATDGQCMGRWTMDEHADGMAVAVLLDISGSMSHNIQRVQGIAEAFATGMEECAKVKRWSFGAFVHEDESFAKIDRLEGETMTGHAVKAAREWLATQTAGQKIIVCVTDGTPNSESRTPEQVELARSEGIHVIGVALGDCQLAISQSMPMATIVSAMDANRLAIALEGITLQL